MRSLVNYFLRGVVFVAPIALTAYVCARLFVTIDGWLGLPVRGAGFVVTFALITLVGFVASNFLARRAIVLMESVLTRLPFVRLLYTSTKDLLNAFVGEKRRFDKPVLVTVLPGANARAIGFVTQESLDHLGLAGQVAVYFPQSYNVAGNLLIFPREQVTRLDAESAAVMAFIVSGGVTAIPAPRARTPGSPSRP